MRNKRKTIIIIWLAVILLLLAACIVTAVLYNGAAGDVKEDMRDAVLHTHHKVSLFGVVEVNPALLSAFAVTAIILLFAAVVRIFLVPRFSLVPGKMQTVLEQVVGMFDGMAKTNSPHRNGFLGVYLFGAAAFIFIGTLFELIGLPAMVISGDSVSLPAPLSDINAAIALGCLSYAVILSGGIASNGIRGVGRTLKDFSLPISMSFRLFGAMLSGLLVTELVYSYVSLSFVVPVLVAVLFTVLHALIQTYVLTMLTALFYGEVTEKHVKKAKHK